MHQAATQPAPAGVATPKKKSRRRRYIIWGSVGLLLLWIISSIISSKREKPVPVITDKAIKRTIIQTVSATGKVQPETEVKISPEVAGEIIELPVADGKVVKKGDLLVKIRPDQYKAILAQQEAAISTAKATTAQQKASLYKAEQDLRRAQDLFNKKIMAEADYTTAKANDEVAKETYESSLHMIEQAEASSSQARDALDKTTIYSPIDGTITILNSKLGERVVATNQFAGTEMMRVADLGHMQAVVDVNENDVVNVKIGDKANVKIDAYGDRRFPGVVQEIAHTGKTTGAGTQEEVTNFEVKINLEVAELLLRPGLSCTAEIQTNMVKDAVAVPMQSVTIRTDATMTPEEMEKHKAKAAAKDKADNNAEVTNERQEKQAQKEQHEKIQKGVFKKVGNKAVWTKVTTGIADDTFMEIKSGIQAGDEVISGSYSAISRKLKDGSAVVIDKEAGK